MLRMLGRRLCIKQPEHLLTLATEVCCESISSCVQYILFKDKTLPSLNEVQKFCSDLQKFIEENIPANHVGAMSVELITKILKHKGILEQNPAVLDMYLLVLKATVNSKMAAFDCCKFKNWKNLYDIEGKELSIMLQGLRLEAFCFRDGCSDGVLNTLVHSCPQLKKLHVTWSTDVTNASFPALLQLKSLQELHIMGTNIDAAGFINMIHTSPVSQTLRSFTCSFIKTSDLNVLLCLCPNLLHIGLNRFQKNAAVIAGENCHIQALSIHQCSYLDFCDLIHALGNRILCLELRLIYHLDVLEMTHKCPSLKQLAICTLINPLYFHFTTNIPVFQNLELLSLNVSDGLEFPSFAVSHSSKLRQLTLLGARNNDVDKVLGNSELASLEELHVCSLSLTTARSLLNRCPKMKMIAGLDASSLKNTTDFIAETFTTHPTVNFSGAVPFGSQMHVEFKGF